MKYEKGQKVSVTPAMTPMARHAGTILRKAKHGWRVQYDAWGMMLTDTFTERQMQPDKEAIAAEYKELIGYDPFGSGGGWTLQEATEILAEYKAGT